MRDTQKDLIDTKIESLENERRVIATEMAGQLAGVYTTADVVTKTARLEEIGAFLFVLRRSLTEAIADRLYADSWFARAVYSTAEHCLQGDRSLAYRRGINHGLAYIATVAG